MTLTWSQYNTSGTNFTISDPAITKINTGWVGYGYSNQNGTAATAWRFFDLAMTSANDGWIGLTYFPGNDPTAGMNNLVSGSGTSVEEKGIYYGFKLDGSHYDAVYNGTSTNNIGGGSTSDTMEIYTDGTTVKLKKNGSDFYTFGSAIDTSKLLRGVFTSSQTCAITGDTNKTIEPPSTTPVFPPPPIARIRL